MVEEAIVIDNGSFECRAGYSIDEEPRLRFRNIVMKSRSKMRETFVGSIDEEVDFCQVNSKSAFEQNVVTQLDVQETVFDYIFSKLGINSPLMNYPIILSEPLCCPQQSRSQITELLFETYSACKLTYFVDGLASFYENFGPDTTAFNDDTMMVSFGYRTTHIVPFSGGTWIPSACRRLSVGGAHVSWYLHQLLSLKYPCHSEKLTLTIAETLIQKFGKVCENYREEMQRWKDETYRQENTQVWCIPYSDETQRRAQELVERKQFQADRLREMHRKRAIDRLKEDQMDSEDSDTQSFASGVKRSNRLEDLTENESDGMTTFPLDGGDSVVLKKLANLREKKAAELLSSYIVPAAVQTQMTTAQPGTTQGLSEQKWKRRALAASDLEARRGSDYCLWLSQINNRRQRIAKQRTLRQSKVDLVTELGLNNQDTMEEVKMSLAGQHSLAERKQRKIEKIRAMTSELKSERGFGSGKRGARGSSRKTILQRDSGRNLAETGSTVDEEVWMDEEEVVALDTFDPFSEDVGGGGDFGDVVSEVETVHIQQQEISSASPTSFKQCGAQERSRLRDAFDRLEEEAGDISECERDQLAVLDSLRAAYDPEFLKETGTIGLKVDISEYYKINLSTEPIRATETLFERSLMGNGQVGVGECLSWVLRDSSRHLFFDSSEPWVPRRLFLTGGLAKLPGMKERLQLELQQLLPWKEGGNHLDVVLAADPSLDAWKGAQTWSKQARENNFKDFSTRQEYIECGFDYLMENAISNRFYASFKDLEVNPKFNPGRGRQLAAGPKQQEA